ncbi:MAG: hypothetical protein HWE23_11060 [Rhodobacteraceae bacterium]|nr:hypothetical protein [Paracoccaceae bacterium]
MTSYRFEGVKISFGYDEVDKYNFEINYNGENYLEYSIREFAFDLPRYTFDTIRDYGFEAANSVSGGKVKAAGFAISATYEFVFEMGKGATSTNGITAETVGGAIGGIVGGAVGSVFGLGGTIAGGLVGTQIGKSIAGYEGPHTPAPSLPVGTVSSMRMPGQFGSVEQGYETNALDVLGDQGGWGFYSDLQKQKAAELDALANSAETDLNGAEQAISYSSNGSASDCGLVHTTQGFEVSREVGGGVTRDYIAGAQNNGHSQTQNRF